jgi:hypothetical protein
VTATTHLSASQVAALEASVARGSAATLALDNDSVAGPLSDAVDESFIDWIGIDIGDTGNPWPRTASEDACAAGVCGDINGDDAVDASDLAILLGAWGEC